MQQQYHVTLACENATQNTGSLCMPAESPYEIRQGVGLAGSLACSCQGAHSEQAHGQGAVGHEADALQAAALSERGVKGPAQQAAQQMPPLLSSSEAVWQPGHLECRGHAGMDNTERHSNSSLNANIAKVGSRMVPTCTNFVWTLAWAGRCAPLLQAPKAQSRNRSLLFCTSGLTGSAFAGCGADLPASGCLTGAGHWGLGAINNMEAYLVGRPP